jgi:hypothetical protein
VRGREELSLLERVGVVQVAGHGRKDLDLGAAGGFVQDVNYCGWRARERPASVADLSAPRAAAGGGRPRGVSIGQSASARFASPTDLPLPMLPSRLRPSGPPPAAVLDVALVFLPVC